MAESDGRRGILVTGATGQVGGALVHALAPLGHVVAPGQVEMDLRDSASLRRAMRKWKPRWIVNAAAYTAVDKAESEADLAWAINAAAPGIIAEEARAIDAAVVHFSTDYVFDGAKHSPYIESDAPGPLNVYGRTKLEGERALEASEVPHIILRTSWVYGARGKNFLKWILRAARERETLHIVADQHGSPTWSEELAEMTAGVIRQVEMQTAQERARLEDVMPRVTGIYHATGAGVTTWFGFAQTIVDEARRLEPKMKLAHIEPIATADRPTPAIRPANSRLDCGKLARNFGCQLSGWQDAVRQVVAQVL